ncbi:phospholipase D-like domain-containing protein [Rubrivirga sp. S365]|uniref:phospholipase D-like domain-containing protein n=1 Tax=Rubrivirga sp. S365 TaxID=3076080 RepID=UPI0028C89807|nr:phospholipase D-like domain-containing protein [Rubrivirga sp. S365]MDT7858342.1 phospholipase D-like domain-containing protein [Rubrivirga sp. S365]
MSWILAHLAVVAVAALTLVAAGAILRERRSSQSTLAWLLAIVLVPYVGLPLYLALGTRKEKRPPIPFPDFAQADALAEAQAPAADRLMRRYGLPGATGGNAFRLLGTGEDAYRALIDLVEGAERSVWVTLFILGDDDAGRGLLAALADAAGRGLDVRLSLDALGSRPLPKARLAPLQQAGGHVAFFEPLLHQPFRGRSNLRNHRKIFLADEARVMAGGMNVAHEYMGPTPDPERWHDLSFRIDGPAVADFVALFRSDWAWASREPLPAPAPRPVPAGPSTVQVVPAGPDVASDALFDLVLSLAFGAHERLWIVTPYFVPEDALARALALAARRDVDVRLVVPDPSNHRLADLARGPALRDLDAAGGRVLRHTGMIHAKALVADDVALVGSANLDGRSLFLNSEVTVVVYDAPNVEAVASWIERLGDASTPGVEGVGPGRQLAEGAAGLVGPLL